MSEYTTVEENQDKKHEFYPMETTAIQMNFEYQTIFGHMKSGQVQPLVMFTVFNNGDLKSGL